MTHGSHLQQKKRNQLDQMLVPKQQLHRITKAERKTDGIQVIMKPS